MAEEFHSHHTNVDHSTPTPLPLSAIPELDIKLARVQRRERFLLSMRFRQAVGSVVVGEYESIFGRDVDTRAWVACLKYAKTISSMLEAHLPDFWRLCKMYLDGKYNQKVLPIDFSPIT